MIAPTVLKQIQNMGGELWVDGDQLRFRIPEKVMTFKMVEALKECKLEIMQFLKAGRPKPHFNSQGELVIPFDSDPKYWWWANGQSIRETERDVQGVGGVNSWGLSDYGPRG
ncbi:MAG: hypothetical protein IH886_06700 [Nitrospinae bacterium]|nr:hypothetical protein [Nitrospinota bacterium]